MLKSRACFMYPSTTRLGSRLWWAKSLQLQKLPNWKQDVLYTQNNILMIYVCYSRFQDFFSYTHTFNQPINSLQSLQTETYTNNEFDFLFSDRRQRGANYSPDTNSSNTGEEMTTNYTSYYYNELLLI